MGRMWVAVGLVVTMAGGVKAGPSDAGGFDASGPDAGASDASPNIPPYLDLVSTIGSGGLLIFGGDEFGFGTTGV